jgi:predicted DNA binding CopG/RHH family protein
MQTISQSASENRPPDVLVPVSVRLPKSLDRAVKIAAIHRGCSKQHLVEEALRAYLGAEAA